MPFEVSRQEGRLLIRLFGAISGDDLLDVARAIQELEDGNPPLHRVTDLTGLEELNLGFQDVEAVAQVRRRLVFAATIRSAIIANQPLHIGYARMFQTLNDNPGIEVRIVSSMEEALQWLAE